MRYALRGLEAQDKRDMLYILFKLSNLAWYGGMAFMGTNVTKTLMKYGFQETWNLYCERSLEILVLVLIWTLVLIAMRWGIKEELEEIARNERNKNKIKVLDNLRERSQERRYKR